MKVLIYGAGSVGLGIASCLLKSGVRVSIIARADTVAALRQYGLVRKGIFGDYHAGPKDFACFTSLSEAPEQVYDYILVSVKSFDSLAAAKDIAKHRTSFNDTTAIVLFQNGWGNAQVFTRFLPKQQIFNARVITGFRRPKLNEVTITVHADAIHIGSLFGAVLSNIAGLCKAIADGGIPCNPTGKIEKDLWAKMLYNCALNPLSAILDVPYGALAQDRNTRLVMDNICGEIFQVLSAAGYETHWQKCEDFLEVFYERLIPDTAEHKSSTLQDILAGKKTEIEALTGAVIALAAEHDIDVPCNRTIYNMIKFIEANI